MFFCQPCNLRLAFLFKIHFGIHHGVNIMEKTIKILDLTGNGFHLDTFVEKYQMVAVNSLKEAEDLLERSGSNFSLLLIAGDKIPSEVSFPEISVPVVAVIPDVDEKLISSALESGVTAVLPLSLGKDLFCLSIEKVIELCSLNIIDFIPGFLKKNLFVFEGEKLLKTGTRNYSLICIEIENFKLINERYSPEKGNEVLRHVGSFFKGQFPKTCLATHFNSDVFVFLVEYKPSYDDVWFSERLKEVTNSAPVHNLLLKFSKYDKFDKSIDFLTLINRTLLALMTIKRQYLTPLAIYDDELASKTLRQHRLIEDMALSLKNNDFEVYYQPKVDVFSSSIVGAEALIRWNHPEFGFIMPNEFIPLFEDYGLISQIDFFVIENVCRHINRWIDKDLPIVPISINLSQIDFITPDLDKKIYELVNRHNVSPSLIHLEITESAYMNNHNRIIEVIKSLRKMDFKIEMDDFGTGYSSFNMLWELPVDVLKLDMQLIQKTDSEIKNSVLSFILALSKWLKLDTIAEGVETIEEVENLKSKGCNLVQGYFYSKPLPLEKFESYLIEHKKLIAEKLLIANLEYKNDEDKRVIALFSDYHDIELYFDESFSSKYEVIRFASISKMCDYFINDYAMLDAVLLYLPTVDSDANRIMSLINSYSRKRYIPVIVISEDSPDNELKALTYGADYFLRMPVSQKALELYLERAFNVSDVRRYKNQLELKSSNIKDLAFQDVLTSSYNRRGLEYIIENLSFGQSHALYIMDIDGFRHYNDTQGYEAGDKVLVKIADKLRKETRDGDVIARLGGDEFVMILLNLSNSELALRKGKRLINAIKTLFYNSSYHPSVSMGATIFKEKKDFKDACMRAEKALYDVKNTKIGGCKFNN